jgi:hypothetical protein
MEHPYRHRPATAFWRSAVAGAAEVDPVTEMAVRIAPGDAVATAGSCFAQHIARHLRERGFRVLRTEAPPEGTDPREGYALFSANHGNIYTARHMRRLFEEAYGLAEPRDIAWRRPDGAVVDALRPRLIPAGFPDAAAMRAARAAHLAALREVFEGCDVFILTLGLIEAWVDRRDGTAFPLPPGIVAEPTDPEAIGFHQFSPEEVRADLAAFLDGLAEVNPAVRCVITVSPVPLVATATGQHVLAASTYGKAVLRVAAEEAARRPATAYFPAYEIVTGPQARDAFAADLRSVAPETVARVMALFERHAMAGAPAALPAAAPRLAAQAGPPALSAEGDAAYAALLNTVCDEEALDPEAG